MAITLTSLSKPHSVGDRWRTIFQAALDNSYPANGYPCPPTALGFASTVDPDFFVQLENDFGFGLRYDYTLQTLRIYSGPVVKLSQSLSPALVAANTTAEQSFVVAGLAANDAVIGVTKPTAQAGLGIAGVRAIDATHIGVTFVNDTAGGLTPTASETYQFAVYRGGAVEVATGTDLSALTDIRVGAIGKFRG